MMKLLQTSIASAVLNTRAPAEIDAYASTSFGKASIFFTMIFSVLFAMPALLSPAPAQLASRTRGARMAAPEGDASSLPEEDLAVLSSKIADVKSGVWDCKLLVLDSMVPGQRLSLTAPPQLVQMVTERDGRTLVMIGRQGASLLSHGVEVRLLPGLKLRPEVPGIHPEGTADIELKAGRMCEITDMRTDGKAARQKELDQLQRLSWQREALRATVKKKLENKSRAELLARSKARRERQMRDADRAGGTRLDTDFSRRLARTRSAMPSSEPIAEEP